MKKMSYAGILTIAVAGSVVSMRAGMGANGIDNVTLRVTQSLATNGASLGAFGYDPSTDSAYVVGFGASGQMYKINNILNGTPVNAAPLAAPNNTWVGSTQLTRMEQSNGVDLSGNPIYPTGTTFLADGVTPSNLGGGQYTVGGIVLNPVAIGSTAAYSRAWFQDAGGNVTLNGSGNPQFNFTKRVYAYDLQQATPVTAPNAAVAHFQQLASKQDFATAIGASTSSSDNFSRQPSWSSDGQSLYMVQGGTTYGGIYKMNPTTGALTRLVADGNANIEPAVVSTLQGDRIYINGTTTNGNNAGLSYYTYDDTTVSAPVAVKTLTDMQQFLEMTLTSGNFASSVALADGTVLANYVGGAGTTLSGVLATQSGPTPTPSNPGGVLVAIAPDGKMYKVTDSRERGISVGTPTGTNFGVNVNILRMQLPVTQTFSGTLGNFQAPTILYDESSPISGIAAVTVYQPGDFNRDGQVTDTDVVINNVTYKNDITLFKEALGLRNSSTTAANLKFDLNGNGSVDWKDVQLLKQFYAFPDGDANIDKKVNQTDLTTFESNWRSTSATWLQGKFDGGAGATPWTDPKVNTIGASDLTKIAANWSSGVAGSDVTRFVADFRATAVTGTGATAGISFATGDVATLAARNLATGGTKVIITPSITITGTGKLDLVDNDLIVQSTLPNAAADLANVKALVATGRAGNWTGSGITSGAAKALQAADINGRELTSLAVVLNGDLPVPFASFDDQAVDANSILVKYTYTGDTDLSGTLTLDDYLTLDRGALLGLTGWQNGDFNYSGTVDAADYALIDYAYFAQGGPLAGELIAQHASQFGDAYTSLVPSLVPEPASLAILALGSAALLNRKKRSANA